MPKSFLLSDEVHEYLVAHGAPPDDVLVDLARRTEELGAVAGMQIAPEQGAFLEFLVRVTGARFAVEVGTFTGYSALCIARGLGPDGRLVCCDVSDEWTSIGRPFWERAGVADRIDLRIGPALETLAALDGPPVEFAFIDADKPNYGRYLDLLLPRLSSDGVIVVDNVLWSGRVVDDESPDENTRALRAFNDDVAARTDCVAVMLPVSDGLTLIRRP